MKYITLSLKYTFKNFFKLSVFAFIPAVLLSFSFDIPAFIDVLRSMQAGDIVPFETIYQCFSLFAGSLWWMKIITVLSLLLVLGILLVTVDKHMRIGRFSFKFYKRLDEAVFSVLPVYVIVILISELFAVVASCVITLFKLMIPISGVPYVSAIIAIFLFLLWSLICVLFINCVPCRIVQGYALGEALGCSVRLVTKRLGKLYLSFLFPFIIMAPLMTVAHLYFGAWALAVYFACYLLFIMYIASFSMSSYFEIFGYERHDVRYKLFK